MKIEIKVEESQDVNVIFRLNQAAFESDSEANLVNNLRSSGSLLLLLIATMERKIVGHIAFSPMKIDGFSELSLVGLAPMAVLPDLQKQGIGSKLISESISRLKTMGVDAVFLLGHKEYYPRFGFKPSYSTFGIKSRYEVPDEVFMAKELKPNILDKVAGQVEYSKEFNEL